MENNRGRPRGSRNVTPLNKKAENVFNDLLKTLKDDLTNSTPGERLAATSHLAAQIINTQKKSNEKIN